MSEPVCCPPIACPRCGREVVDYDGFGLLACTHCDYCTHPCSTGEPNGDWVCDICGTVVGKWPMPKEESP